MVLLIEQDNSITMNRITYVFSIVIFIAIAVSCGSSRDIEDMAVYERERVGEMPSSYIILKGGALKQCDFICNSYGISGNYVVSNDTLYVYNKYTYYSESINYFDTLNIKPQKFLIKKDYLVDVTRYTLDIINDSTDFYINEFLKNLPNTVYKRLQIKGKSSGSP